MKERKNKTMKIFLNILSYMLYSLWSGVTMIGIFVFLGMILSFIVWDSKGFFYVTDFVFTPAGYRLILLVALVGGGVILNYFGNFFHQVLKEDEERRKEIEEDVNERFENKIF